MVFKIKVKNKTNKKIGLLKSFKFDAVNISVIQHNGTVNLPTQVDVASVFTIKLSVVLVKKLTQNKTKGA